MMLSYIWICKDYSNGFIFLLNYVSRQLVNKDHVDRKWKTGLTEIYSACPEIIHLYLLTLKTGVWVEIQAFIQKNLKLFIFLIGKIIILLCNTQKKIIS